MKLRSLLLLACISFCLATVRQFDCSFGQFAAKYSATAGQHGAEYNTIRHGAAAGSECR